MFIISYKHIRRNTPVSFCILAAMDRCPQTCMMKTTRAVALTRSQPAPTTRIPLILHALACKMAPSSCLDTRQMSANARASSAFAAA